MKFIKNCFFSAIGLIIFATSSLQECGERLRKGSVVCSLGAYKNYDKFDFEKCTHVALPVSTKCKDNVCAPSTTEFDELNNVVQRHFPENLGIYFNIGAEPQKIWSDRIARVKTLQSFVKFMEERKLSFIFFNEDFSEGGYDKNEGRSTLLLFEEFAKLLHDRGWHAGLSLTVGLFLHEGSYNFKKLSEFIDWFSFVPKKRTRDREDKKVALELLYPLTLTSKYESGTLEYWFRYFLTWFKPECLVIGLETKGLSYVAFDSTVEPGLHSPGLAFWRKSVYNSQICARLTSDTVCREYWDEETSSPWAVCGDDFYTYWNARSVALQLDLARRWYSFSSVMITDSGPQNECSDKELGEVLEVLQIMRNDTVT